MRHLSTIHDISNDEIETLFDVADKMSRQLRESKSLNICPGYEMVSLFLEPSTRTRLSFEVAMHRLGGNVTSVVDKESISIAKGETIADTAKIIGGYADIIAVRHSLEGTPKVIAQHAGVPVINAGDGAHQHPTQTLTDLYTLKKEKGKIEGLTVALCGDLKFGRTVHSLAYALARFNAHIVLISALKLDMPEHLVRRLGAEYGCQIEEFTDVRCAVERINACYDKKMAEKPRILVLNGLWGDFFDQVDKIQGIDVFYATRVQKERFSPVDKEKDKDLGKYSTVDSEALKKIREDALILHPLPRVDELAYKIDSDLRSAYFRQAANGIPIRMALITFLLGVGRFAQSDSPETETGQKTEAMRYKSRLGVKCCNPQCISTQEEQSGQVVPEFYVISADDKLTLRCIYCEWEVKPQFIGKTKSGVYSKLESKRVQLDDDTIFFESAEKAEEAGLAKST